MKSEVALNKMVAPGQKRPSAWRQGIIQMHVTRACDRACSHCTQTSNWKGKPYHISPENFEALCVSLQDYWGVVGIFGGNPAVHPKFEQLMEIYIKYVPYEQRGLWCNHPRQHGKLISQVFNPSISNLNVHQSQEAYDAFKEAWPACKPVGLKDDSRHSPVFGSMAAMGIEEEKRWELISKCDINQYWSAMVGAFRGQPRAWFCEIAGAQSIANQHVSGYPDTGVLPLPGWWQKPMDSFYHQVVTHCHNGCLVPLQIHGELANDQQWETVGKGYNPKLKRDIPTNQLYNIEGVKSTKRVVDYIGNANET
jgi:hypothetical protein